MTDLERLTVYVERLKTLADTNSVYNNVTIKIPPETIITEMWHNGREERFHSTEFPFSDIEAINKKLYDKIRYQEAKNAETH